MWCLSRRRSTAWGETPSRENMPRWVRMKSNVASPVTLRNCCASSIRMSEIRVRICPSSSIHSVLSDALAVQAQILGKRYGDQRFRNLLRDQAQAGGIGIEIDGEALIGQIQKWDEAPAPQQFSHRLPLRRIEIGAGGIVTTGMKQYHVS